MSGVEGVKVTVLKDLGITGNFEVTVGEEKVFSKQDLARFPLPTEVEKICADLEAKAKQ